MTAGIAAFFILLRRLIEVILAVANIIIMYVTDFSDDADDTSVIGYRYKCCILRSFESIVVCYVCATATTYVSKKILQTNIQKSILLFI